MTFHRVITPVLSILCFIGIANASSGKHNDELYSSSYPAHTPRVSMAKLIECIEPGAQDIARPIVQRVYESQPRPIKDQPQYGYSFAINPEMLHDLIKRVPGATVLEVGGARGELSIFMGLAGAKRVYMNDIVPAEVKDFEVDVAQLPTAYQNKFIPLCCDYKHLADELPEGSLDIVVVRNLLHFLVPSAHKDFFDVLKKLLKPTGHLFLTTNSRHAFDQRDDFDPEITTFKAWSLVGQVNQNRSSVLGRVIQSCVDVNPLEYKQMGVESRFMQGGKTMVKQGEAQDLPDSLRLISGHFMDTFQRKAQDGIASVGVCINTSLLFTPSNLAALLKQYGFMAKQVTHIKADGHVASDRYVKEKGAQCVGVIARPVTPVWIITQAGVVQHVEEQIIGLDPVIYVDDKGGVYNASS